MVLGGMKERGRGLVVNVGSGAASAIPSGPLLATYTATKASDSLGRVLGWPGRACKAWTERAGGADV